MTENHSGKNLIIDAGMGVDADLSAALTAAGYSAEVVLDLAEDEQNIQINEFISGVAEGENGNVICLYGPSLPVSGHLQALALHLAPKVRINAIGPCSAGETDIEQWSSVPLGSKLPTAEIVGAIQFILDTPSLTGQTITLNG